MKRILGLSVICLSIVLLQGCVTQPKKTTQAMKIATGSRFDVLTPVSGFQKNRLPPGWVLEGINQSQMFHPDRQVKNLFMVKKDGELGLHIQNDVRDFVLARYVNTRLLVTPFLTWRWNVSEHKGLHHPVKLIVGMYGGAPGSGTLNPHSMIWNGSGLPPYDRLLTIGFDDTALKRANIYSLGKVKYYVQRGGIEQTNQWYFEAADLSMIYRQSWPKDDLGKAFITFVGLSAQTSPNGGGMTFSNIRLSR